MTRSDTTTDDVHSDEGDPGLTGSDTTVTSGNGNRGASRRIIDRVTSLFGSDIEPREFTDAERHRIHEDTITDLSKGDGRLLRIDPSPEGASISAAKDVFKRVARFRETVAFGLWNESPVMSFEVWKVDDELTFNMFVPNSDDAETVKKKLGAQYEAASVETVWEASEVRAFLNRQMETGEYTDRSMVPLPDDKIPMPRVSNAKYIAGAEFEMKASRIHPVKTGYDAEDEKTVRKQDDPEMRKNDPYKGVISQMIADNRNHFVMQVVFSPAKDGWANKWWWYYDPTRTSLKNLEEDYTLSDKHMSADDSNDAKPVSDYLDDVQERTTNHGFRVEIRVLGYGENKQTIKQGVRDIGEEIESGYESQEQEPVCNAVNGDALLNMLDSVVARNLTPGRVPWREYNPSMYLSASEMAMFAHLPNNDVESSMISWQRKSVENQIPSGAERIGEVLASTSTFPLNRKPVRIPPDPDRFEDDATIETHGSDENVNEYMTETSTTDTSSTAGDTATTESMDSTGTNGEQHTDEKTSENERGVGTPDSGWVDDVSGTVEYCENQSRWVSAKMYSVGAVLGLLGLGIVLYSVLAFGVLEFATGIGTIGIGAGVIMYEWKRRHKRWYVVTDKAVYMKLGILSLDLSGIRFENIKRTEITKTKIQNMMIGTGTVGIVTSGEDDVEMELTYVKDPSEVKHAIQTLTDQEDEHKGEE